MTTEANKRPEKLAAFIASRRRVPFAWGKNDCALFAADWVKELTGVDHAEKFRGYTDEKGAARQIKKAGGMRAFASALKEKNPKLVQRGDIVLALIEGRETFGVADMSVYFSPGPNGLIARPLREVIAAFEV